MVKVELKPHGSNYDGSVVEHENASAIKVIDGHLHAYNGTVDSPEFVAIYAPQTWVNAVVEQ
jgi:hypothetical protein